MAEVAVEIVLKNLADVIVKEAQLLGGVGTKVERVQRELTRIKSCLQDAESKRKGDERVQNWLNELCDEACRIEDAIDTFFLEVEDQHQKKPGGVQNSNGCSRCLQKLKKLFKKALEVPILHKLGNELDDIQNQLEEMSKSRLAYRILDLTVEDKSKGEAVRMPFRRAADYEVDESEVVGLQIDKNNILELLRPEQTPRLAVITIVGMGGLGKTTLAHMVYTSARADFDYHIMLSISQQFSLTDLLRKMISKYNDSVPKDQDVDYYLGELKSFLRSKRYLIILDDVWEDDVWNVLTDVLFNVNENGSRVLITSRCIEVVKSAEYQMIQYELNFLDDRKSLDLLLKVALPYQAPDVEYPINLLELAHKLSKKCKGLPLALRVLGGILATKELSYPAWERVLQTMNWHSDGSVCMQILAMSYEVMPYYLKACFLYLVSFPQNYVISAKSLIRIWIAEEFIPLEGRPTIQIMAEDCLEQLSKRSMVQVLSRHANGLIKHFQVHNILRELAMHEAENENFVTIFSQASVDRMPNRRIQRASLQAQEKNSQFIEYVGSTTRSLLLFVSEYSRTSLHCSKFRLLKVLKIEGIRDGYDLKSLGDLIFLKYLGFTKCNIDLSSCSFHRMKSLQTLDVRQTFGTPPCDDFWWISTLMHVRDAEYGTFFDRPISIANLTNVQTLKWVTLQRGCDVKLPNLRKLGIRNKTNEWVSITNVLQTLPFLVYLGISAFGYVLPMEIIYPKALPNYQNLQSLYLDGEWPKNVNIEASLLPPNLVKLTLEWSLLNHNPMPELGKLESLKTLRLRDVFPLDWEGPIICPEGFPVLQYLTVSDTYIKELRVAQGVMPKLTYLQVEKITMVHLPPELQHVRVET